MFWFFVALTVVVVVVIGLVAVGRVTFTLAEQPRSSSYALDEAVDFVADNLSEDVTGQISYGDVREILGLHLDYLEAKGVAHTAITTRPMDDRDDDAQPETTDEEDSDPRPLVFPEWPEASARGPLVADDDEALPYILGRLAESEHEIDDVHVVEVLEVERLYLEAIGAIGPAVPTPDDPID